MESQQEYLDKQAAIMNQNYDSLVAEGKTTIYLGEVVKGTFLEKMYSEDEKRNKGWQVNKEDVL